MVSWLVNNIGTIVVALIVCALIIFAAVKMFVNKKKGKSSCNCGCASCPMNGKCHH